MIWQKHEIIQARATPLVPVLQKCGYKLKKLRANNFRVIKHGDLIVKEHYWLWPSKNMKGSAIDYFIFVEQKTFQEAMRILSDRETTKT